MNVPVSNLRQQILSVMKVGRPADALREVERALTIEPRNPTFLICRAQCLAALGRIAGACEAAAAAEAVIGSEPMLWDAIGTVYSRGNDQRRALAAYNRAIALGTGAGRGRLRSGHCAQADRLRGVQESLGPAHTERGTQPHRRTRGSGGGESSGLARSGADPLRAGQGIRGSGRLPAIIPAPATWCAYTTSAHAVRRRARSGDR